MAVPPPVHDAAVDGTPEIPLEVIVLRIGCADSPGVETKNEIVAPLLRGIGDTGRDEHRIAGAKEPHQSGTLPGRHPHLGWAELDTIDGNRGRGRFSRRETEMVSVERS